MARHRGGHTPFAADITEAVGGRTEIDIVVRADDVQPLLPQLLEKIQKNQLAPNVIIAHRLKLGEAARGYAVFNDKQENYRKVVPTP